MSKGVIFHANFRPAYISKKGASRKKLHFPACRAILEARRRNGEDSPVGIESSVP
jgi:hypothetical protein